MPQILATIFLFVVLMLVVPFVFRVFGAVLELAQTSKSRAAIEEEMLQEIRQLNAKVDALMAAANVQSANKFIQGGKNEN